MTTPPHTGSEPDDQPGVGGWELPDEATLNRLAGEYFSRLPGSGAAASPATAAADGASQPGQVPGASLDTVTVPQGFESQVPVAPASPTGPPDGSSASSAATSYGATPAEVAAPWIDEGVSPSELTTELPGVSTDAPASSSFYFLDPPNGYRSGSGGVDTSRGYTIPVSPQEMPAVSDRARASMFVPSTSDVGAPSFYFLDRGTGATDTAPPMGRAGPHGPAMVDAHPGFDVNAVRRDFPILRERVNGYPLVWFDNAATTQKPQVVIDRISYFYEHENSNIHRAAHELAARSTDAYEQARQTVARFIGASSAEEIVFVRGATEAINLVAQTWGRKNIRQGDEIVIAHLEHHANIVPWQMLASETGAVIRVIPVDDSGQLMMGEYTRLLSDRTKLVAVAQVSNALGTITPVREITEEAHRAGAIVLVDGAQSVPHTGVDMQSLDPDFFVFSGHKIFGPTGIGALYGKPDVLADTPPWQGGGNMITDVTLERSTYQLPPGRFEAGTGSIADGVGLGAAIEYVERIGIENINRYEHVLLEYATAELENVPGLRLIGTAAEKASVISFVLAGYEPLEVGKALNSKGIAVRAGHHCAQPIMRRFGVEGTVRPSLSFYNTCEEVDRMVAVLHQLAADAGRRS
ncbi:family 2A encapsulin nanocompartment cargo protein cysteine desulfurase [Rhodococcus sp. T2V]|uniref:family 2A encapsulin nanocompartment cargo protein cysteine desulfurase n=1 Tax=Rhodococcus sp. T2V TaxID=3034164 RepID=UPI0023E344AE|nr:family 2A encapsulin nanocompartment cargo protein cysteine desulfurase [Rhodococcus sp. T2V]MDF3311534.1 family 2A encapsulin nanocompartment cargo protein cysteine desulfurase [Rhodococcus sp. T2V]